MIEEDHKQRPSVVEPSSSNSGGGTASSSASASVVSEKKVPVALSAMLELSRMSGADALDKETANIPFRRGQTIRSIEKYLRSKLSIEESQSIFLYCSGFAPTSDQTLGDLFDSFQKGKKLSIQYGYQEPVSVVLSAMAGADVLDKMTANILLSRWETTRAIEKYLRKKLSLKDSQVGSLFLYCSGFAPTSDQTMGDLFDVKFLNHCNVVTDIEFSKRK